MWSPVQLSSSTLRSHEGAAEFYTSQVKIWDLHIASTSNNLSKDFSFLYMSLKIDKTEEDEPVTSANPVLELELTEEKLPMTLSRQEVSRY